MKESIESVKQRLSQLYLGKCGIHGMGIRRSTNALFISINSIPPQNEADQAAVLREIELKAAPFPVMVIKEDTPSIADWVSGGQNALGSPSTALEPEKPVSSPQTTEARYIMVDSPPPRVESFRKQRSGPYFKAQINATVYLSSKLGHLLLAGEPQKKGEELQIPVFHAFIGMEQPIGFLRADAHTFQMIDDPDVMSTLHKSSEVANGNRIR